MLKEAFSVYKNLDRASDDYLNNDSTQHFPAPKNMSGFVHTAVKAYPQNRAKTDKTLKESLSAVLSPQPEKLMAIGGHVINPTPSRGRLALCWIPVLSHLSQRPGISFIPISEYSAVIPPPLITKKR